MKTVAYLSDFAELQEQERLWLERIKTECHADCMLGIMSGDYLQNGLPSKRNQSDRKKTAQFAGVDILVEMSLFTSVSNLGIYAFSIARILDKMKLVDEIVLETDSTSGELLNRIAMFLIRNDKQFQIKVSAYKKDGLNFYPAQAKALEEYIPGSEKVMNSICNIFAVEVITSLKFMYSRIQITFVDARSYQSRHTTEGNEFSDYLRYQLYLTDRVQQLDIYGGNDVLCKIIEKYRMERENFHSLAALIASKGFDEVEVRKFFLRMLLQIKNTDISMWRMYDFAPYCKCSAMRMSAMDKKSWKEAANTILLFDAEDEEKLNRSMKNALEKEVRCADIYKMVMEKKKE